MKRPMTNFQVVMETNKRTYSSLSKEKREILSSKKHKGIGLGFFSRGFRLNLDIEDDDLKALSSKSNNRQPDEDDISEVTIVQRASSSKPSSSSLSSSNKPKSSLEPVIRLNCDRSSPVKYSNSHGVNPSSLRTLEPRRMLNDDIIEFYLNYLTSRIKPEDRKRMHLFSTFFYSKLVHAHKLDDSSESAFTQTCVRWDKGVEIFKKDFLVIPVCQHLHWSLVIVCFPKNVESTDTDDEIIIDCQRHKFDASCILIFDSLRHKRLSKFAYPIRKFLAIRWSQENPGAKEKHFTNPACLKEYNALVPMQRNSYDCGIHLLCTFEKFLQSPVNTSFEIREGYDLANQWNFDTKAKRDEIRRLIEDKK